MDARTPDIVADMAAKGIKEEGALRFIETIKPLYSDTDTYGALWDMASWLRRPEHRHPADVQVANFGRGALLSLFVHSKLLTPSQDSLARNYLYSLARDIRELPRVQRARTENDRQANLSDGLRGLGFIGLQSLRGHPSHQNMVILAGEELGHIQTRDLMEIRRREVAFQAGYGIVRYAHSNITLETPTARDAADNLEMARLLQRAKL